MLVAQMAILGLLAFVVAFGGSVTLDMIVHRWWAGALVYALATGALIARAGGVGGLFYVPLAAGSAGAGFASWGVRALRDRGYRLFQETPEKRRAPAQAPDR